MTFYCKVHPDFEGLDIGKLHDHVDQEHEEVRESELAHQYGYKAAFAKFYTENVEEYEGRRSDNKIVSRTWGRPPKLGQFVSDNERAKK